MVHIGVPRQRATSFPRQFVLATSPRSVPDGWIHKAMQGWSLWHCPFLPAHPILDEAGIDVGWLLGEAVLERAAGEAIQVAEPVRSPAFLRSLELALHRSQASSLQSWSHRSHGFTPAPQQCSGLSSMLRNGASHHR
jgi:hypothetical protein